MGCGQSKMMKDAEAAEAPESISLDVGQVVSAELGGPASVQELSVDVHELQRQLAQALEEQDQALKEVVAAQQELQRAK